MLFYLILSKPYPVYANIDAITVVFSPRPQLGDSFGLCSFHGAAIQTIVKLIMVSFQSPLCFSTWGQSPNCSFVCKRYVAAWVLNIEY